MEWKLLSKTVRNKQKFTLHFLKMISFPFLVGERCVASQCWTVTSGSFQAVDYVTELVISYFIIVYLSFISLMQVVYSSPSFIHYFFFSLFIRSARNTEVVRN